MNKQKNLRVIAFAVPKPFIGHIGIIQWNALRSWSRLPFIEHIILIGNEEGTAAASDELGATHIAHVARDAYGTPLVDDIFRLAAIVTDTNWLLYVNSDILLTPRFALDATIAMARGPGLIISRRWNADVTSEIEFEKNWENYLTRVTGGRPPELFNEWGIDVFLFSKGLFGDIPPFSLGRCYWDNWLVHTARKAGTPVTDITEEATVIHQNHTYLGFSTMDDVRHSQQGVRNFWLAGDSYYQIANTNDATHFLKAGEIVPSGRITVSVVIWHTSDYSDLSKCVNTFSYQTYPRSYVEIIVIEAPSGRGSAVNLVQFPFIKSARETKPVRAAGMNKGAAIADGDLLIFLDSCCRPAGDWIEEIVAFTQSTNCMSVIVCNVRSRSKNNHLLEERKSITDSAMVVPTAIWRQVGPFDQSFNHAGDEAHEWSARASLFDVQVIHSQTQMSPDKAPIIESS